MRNYSITKRAALGVAAIAAALITGCRSAAQYPTHNPFFNNNVPHSSNVNTPVFSEPAEGIYENKNINVIVRNSKRKIVTGDISSKLEVGDKYQAAGIGAKAIIKLTESTRIVPEIQGIAARKVYPSGSAAETESLIAGVRVGKYIGTDPKLYFEGRIHGECGVFAGRIKEKHAAGFAGFGVGLFSEKTGTYLRAILEGGPGKYEMDLTSISDEDKTRIGLDPSVDRVNGSLLRCIGDLQGKQTIVDPVYAKARLSLSLQDRKDWNDYFAVASELGFGLEGKVSDTLKRGSIDFSFTHRNELNDYFNKTSKHKNIMGAKLGVGAQLGNNHVAKLTFKWDEELGFGAEAKWSIRWR